MSEGGGGGCGCAVVAGVCVRVRDVVGCSTVRWTLGSRAAEQRILRGPSAWLAERGRSASRRGSQRSQHTTELGAAAVSRMLMRNGGAKTTDATPGPMDTTTTTTTTPSRTVAAVAFTSEGFETTPVTPRASVHAPSKQFAPSGPHPASEASCLPSFQPLVGLTDALDSGLRPPGVRSQAPRCCTCSQSDSRACCIY